jgi:hypothetical protein
VNSLASHPRRVAAFGVAGLIVFVGVLFALTNKAGSAQKPNLSAQSAQHSPIRVGPGPVERTIAAGGLKLKLAIEPNSAAAHNVVAIALTRGGSPVSGARIAITYGMPAMAMNNVFTSTLPGQTAGAYSIREPVEGMAGLWTMHVHVTPASGAPFDLVVADVLRP